MQTTVEHDPEVTSMQREAAPGGDTVAPPAVDGYAVPGFDAVAQLAAASLDDAD